MENRVAGLALTEEESSRLILARALEWEALPVFATRTIAPIAMFWADWWMVLAALAGCSLIWCPIRQRVVSLRIAMIVSFLNNLYVSLAANLIVAVVFFAMGKYGPGVVALLWHFISTFLALVYPPTKTSTIQEKLMAHLFKNPMQ